jgi:hypothetical protein
MLWGFAWTSNSIGNYDLLLHNDAGTLLDGISVDGDILRDGRPIGFDTPQTLTKDTWYRLSVEATAASPDLSWQTITLPSADYIGSTPWGANGHLTTWNGSAWDDTGTTIIPVAQLSLLQLDNGVGASAGFAYTFA